MVWPCLYELVQCIENDRTITETGYRIKVGEFLDHFCLLFCLSHILKQQHQRTLTMMLNERGFYQTVDFFCIAIEHLRFELCFTVFQLSEHGVNSTFIVLRWAQGV
eukprot:NODE_1458_length_1728_cov_100.502181_g1382_i0.p2 GENE.NODE_1458_length_1728_cov_100.502181_g1382_i0~~NODE_1458_length_1728_cov_100.502181_g1382_i0.p2  ORF type:complete len:106 (+),score=1.07 NODE_1458_length_1728_cov_100.502181_g1382_i0:157-474(+)